MHPTGRFQTTWLNFVLLGVKSLRNIHLIIHVNVGIQWTDYLSLWLWLSFMNPTPALAVHVVCEWPLNKVAWILSSSVHGHFYLLLIISFDHEHKFKFQTRRIFFLSYGKKWCRFYNFQVGSKSLLKVSIADVSMVVNLPLFHYLSLFWVENIIKCKNL